VIAILSPTAVLTLIKTLPDPNVLFTKCRIILDDSHHRSLEADTLVGYLIRGTSAAEECPGRFILMSAASDPLLVKYVGRVEDVTKEDPPIFKVTTRKIEPPIVIDVPRRLVHD
jgi:HrpA-like RNA helicase